MPPRRPGGIPYDGRPGQGDRCTPAVQPWAGLRWAVISGGGAGGPVGRGGDCRAAGAAGNTSLGVACDHQAGTIRTRGGAAAMEVEGRPVFPARVTRW